MQCSLKNFSIRVQVMLPVLVATFALAVSLWIIKNNLEGARENASVMRVLYKDQTNLLAVNVVDDINDMRFHVSDSIISPALRKDLMAKLLLIQKRISSDLILLQKDEYYQNDVPHILKLVDEFLNRSKQMLTFLEQYEAGTASVSEFVAKNALFREQAIDLLATVVNVINRAEEREAKAYAEIEAYERYEMNLAIIIVLSVLGISLVIAWVLSTMIVAPIQHIQGVMRELALGNLTVRATVEGKNEISILSQDVNTTASQLHSMVDHLNRIGEEVASASTELAAVMTQAESNAQQELSEIEQVASAVNELSSTADNVSDNASVADSTARMAYELAKSGLAISQESVQASVQMSESLNNAASLVQRLKDQSEKINDVVEVIRNVSEQTNLLALNAAIEAARAGETGRGFAVVADEVRMLAGRTESSTKEIGVIIEDLQNQSVLANDSMQSTIDILAYNCELTQRVSDALVGISESVSDINDSNTQVATAAEQQSQVTQDINRNVLNISELVHQNVTGISQSASASTELSQLAEKQKAQLAFFKL
ncbi:methyl-accepting chemotaxis protein [Vibrio cholerae]|uniref:methyl-accepting chemotaxis protein n=2 Tax=Vibrio cholerae TaxID=666 RepID=UPI000E0C8743|nr:methyl-accepting chemotaxis protein [Vibrio cholerae]EGQ7639647.1 methyl-accepting chemotaxis protein [Vibrio cholerae]EHE6925639.1 methyl-accepting chemotaxis protein [Vibrio cholerae]EHE6948805.1 methyl-accepting chemotaxis protein [Vibrio cholerae]EJN3161471.1 methyl-accepting chemotaxis protein [Vibrio cholerae]EJX7570932.1 methyl-accepting chemotaxis protein [Vibrio cholerae]